MEYPERSFQIQNSFNSFRTWQSGNLEAHSWQQENQKDISIDDEYAVIK